MEAPDDGSRQTTGKGAEIPIPKRDDVLAALRKIGKAGEGAPDDEAPSA